MPVLLSRAERLVVSVEEMGAEAGEGAVGGFVSGIFSLPFDIVGGVGKTILSGVDALGGEELTEKDREIIREKIYELANFGREGESINWDNPESQKRGKITLLKKYTRENQECRQVMFEIWVKKKKTGDITGTICQEIDGSWIEKK